MTTTQEMVEETKRYLLSSHREQLNTLSVSCNSSTTSIVMSFELGAIGQGSVIGVGYELMQVWSVDASTKTATVRRGIQGSTAATHSADDLVTVNPRFSDFAVLQALNMSLNDMTPDLFQVVGTTFTYIAGREGYDFPDAATAAPLAVLDVSYDYPGIHRSWPKIMHYRIERFAADSTFPSGYGFILKEPAFPGRDVRVIYAAEFTDIDPTAGPTADIVTATGLPSNMHDIPPLGAAVRLQGVREGQRNFNESQPDTRRAAEVPAGAQMQSIRALQDFYQKRIQSERKTLLKKYPYQTTVEFKASTLRAY